MAGDERQLGTVIRSVGGFHTVSFPDGEEVRAVARGRIKLKGAILAGDRVLVRIIPGGDAIVEEVLERDSQLVRPPVANVSLAVVVMSCAMPPPNLDLLDRILLHVELERIRPIVVFAKVDLIDDHEAARLAAPYKFAGYSTIFTSAHKKTGIEELAQILATEVSVLSGPSGVGKSSLLNALIPGADLDTGPVSAKTQRGRHTTREVSLLRLPGGGWVADSPGFSTLAAPRVDPRELPALYPEFRGARCRFPGCLHRKESDCAVLEALEQGEIDAARYRRYLRILSEVELSFERRY